MTGRRRHMNGISWVEKAPAQPQPAIDQIAPLVPATPEVAMPGGLYGNTNAGRDTERKRKVDRLLEEAGVRPRHIW